MSNNKKGFGLLVLTAFALVVFSGQTLAEKALHYGDINDENVAWYEQLDGVKKVSLKTKPQSKKVSKILTKKISEIDLEAEYTTGYGDEGYDED